MQANDIASETETDCAHFERTLALLDGISGADETAARAHARGCPVCGPLVEGWAAARTTFLADLEDEAERAKPNLAFVADRVLARVDAEAPCAATRSAAPHGTAWLLRLVQPWAALAAAAAALAMVLWPLAHGPEKQQSIQQVAAAAADDDDDDPALAGNVCHIHKVTFDDADGVVYRTARGGMTVIWISEHEGV